MFMLAILTVTGMAMGRNFKVKYENKMSDYVQVDICTETDH